MPLRRTEPKVFEVKPDLKTVSVIYLAMVELAFMRLGKITAWITSRLSVIDRYCLELLANVNMLSIYTDVQCITPRERIQRVTSYVFIKIYKVWDHKESNCTNFDTLFHFDMASKAASCDAPLAVSSINLNPLQADIQTSQHRPIGQIKRGHH